MAERKGSAFRRRLRSADFLSESAIARGLPFRNTPFSKSSALLLSITCRDQYFLLVIHATYLQEVIRQTNDASVRWQQERLAAFPVWATFQPAVGYPARP